MKRKELNYEVSQKTRLALWLVLNMVLCLTIESISALYIGERLIYLAMHPRVFLINCIVLMILTSPTLFFDKMPFAFSLFTVALMGFAHTSKILLLIRGLPLTWPDFFILKDGLSIANKYMSLETSLFILLLFCIAILLLKKAYHYRFVGGYSKGFIVFLLIMTTINVGIVVQAKKFEEESMKMPMGSSEDGTVYGFVTSYKGNNNVIEEHYNEESIGKIKEKVKGLNVHTLSDKVPNILFLQTESFIDPYSLKSITYNEDPIPCMRPYLSSKSAGKLQVPDVNTARTEFEVLTGIRIEDLFQYQVPYTSELVGDRAIETMGQLLKREGYHTTAIHNNKAEFYGRDKVYSLLGFENFIALEDMKNVEYSTNWATDKVLYDYVTKTLETTKNRDFIYTVTVGTHSSYSTEYENPNSIIKVGGNTSDETIRQVQDYVDRLHETDAFIGRLMAYIQKSKEPTVLVVYGDHIPALEAITYDQTYIKDQVPYFIMSNFEMENKVRPVTQSYKLYTEIFNLLNIRGGILQEVHNSLENEEDYFRALDLVSYDLLAGKSYITNEKTPYEITNLQRGIPKKD